MKLHLLKLFFLVQLKCNLLVDKSIPCLKVAENLCDLQQDTFLAVQEAEYHKCNIELDFPNISKSLINFCLIFQVNYK